MNEITRKDTVQTFTHDQYEVRVIWIEYSGGGMGYEFEVEDAGTIIHMSEDGYGQALPAAAGAYAWVENHNHGDDDQQPNQDAQPGNDQDEASYEYFHPFWIPPVRMRQANTCPSCGEQAGVSFDEERCTIADDDETITIERDFSCVYCSDFWTQTIIARIGQVVSNKTKLH